MENLTLVIPAKFEATTLPIVLKEIKDLVKKRFEFKFNEYYSKNI